MRDVQSQSAQERTKRGRTVTLNSNGDLDNRLPSQLDFLREIDRLKGVLRRTSLIDRSRLENSAEHSWHLGVMALTLAEYAPHGSDLNRATAMLLIHDVVEIDAGDTFAFDVVANADKVDRETAAAARLFGMLPEDSAQRMRELWEEFEAAVTPTARFANALDRFQGLLVNDAPGDGGTWRLHEVSSSQIMSRMAPIESGAPALWPVVLDAVERAVSSGHVRDDRK